MISDQQEIHHLLDVLRLKEEDLICIFNGRGQEAACRITKLSRKIVETKMISLKKNKPKKKASIILACAIPKKAKFELVIEKCTELGVDEIIPLKTKRTEVHLNKEKAQKKSLRYQTVAINAVKQSKRVTVPRIHPVTKFEDLINSFGQEDIVFLPCLTGKRIPLHKAFPSLIADKKRIIFLIGPEGDFTPQEIDLAVQSRCIPVSLGNTVLKVDTAAISVVAMANLLT